MPGWAQYVIGLAALFGAGTVLWGKVIKPLVRLASDHDELERTVLALEQRVADLEQKGD